MSDIFLSYNREDQAIARHFAEGFERAGFSVWWDVTLKSGEDFDQVTEQALESASAVVVLWSKKSVASRWVRAEATQADRNKTLVPVTIEPCKRPIMFELKQTADLTHWQGDADDAIWQAFLIDVRQFVMRDRPAGAVENAATPIAAMRKQTRSRKSLASRSGWFVAAAATLVAVVLAIPAVQHLREIAPPPLPETRLEIVTPATDAPTDFALSPDGRQIVFVATGEGGLSQLWLRSLATTTAQPLVGTEGAEYPCWSPDGRSIGFIAGSSLMRLDPGGGAPQTLAPVTAPRGASWGTDNIIIFSPGTGAGLMRVPASGGETAAVTLLAPQQQSHRYPHFLPDGRRFLFYIQSSPDIAGIYLGNLDGSAPVKLTLADSAGVFLPGGWLLWARAGTLTAQRLALEQATLTGDALTLAEGVADNTINLSALAVATSGLIAYRIGKTNGLQLTWVDRAGAVLGMLGDPNGNMVFPRVSPDGRRVALQRGASNNTDLWLLDGVRTSRFTFDAASDIYPLWSPDGSSIVFRSNRSGGGDIYQKLASGAGTDELLVDFAGFDNSNSWSADGRFLLFSNATPETDADLWLLPMTEDSKPLVFLQTRFREAWGAFSPDGRWVAYQSNESGRDEIYVRKFVAPGVEDTTTVATGGQWQVSTTGGVFPTWSADGQELYYLNEAGDMMALPITATQDTFEAGVPAVLFFARILGGGVDNGRGRQYDVAPDGRFLINTVLDDVDDPITLIQNWNPDVAP